MAELRTPRHGESFLGKLVGRMVRRSVRLRFRNVYWQPPNELPKSVLFACNHHGWYDGYLIYLVASKLQKRTLDWIQEFDAFPLFREVGGMPFPVDRPEARAAVIRRTIQLIRDEQRSLMVFGDGVLRPGPEIPPLGKAIDLIVRKTGIAVVPTAIVYEFGLHERPEAFLALGQPIRETNHVGEIAHQDLVNLFEQTRQRARTSPEAFAVLHRGTGDINERWDMRRRFGK